MLFGLASLLVQRGRDVQSLIMDGVGHSTVSLSEIGHWDLLLSMVDLYVLPILGH